VSLRISIPVVLGLILLAVVGVVQAAAKDHPSTAEGVLFWLSLFALPLLLLCLVALVVVAIRRGVKRDVGTDLPS
jgi:peptidoglycan/LPS O-acetylase OafA/YrhL